MSGIDDISKILNNKVDLITNSNIRYEGVLIQIKTEDKRLLLQNVKSFGTEGRNNGVNEVPTPAADDPNNLYSYVEFQIPMIKELYIVDKPSPVASDPAIVSVKQEEKPEKAPEEASDSKDNFYDEDLESYENERPYRGGHRGYRRGRGRGRARRGHGGFHDASNRGGFKPKEFQMDSLKDKSDALEEEKERYNEAAHK